MDEKLEDNYKEIIDKIVEKHSEDKSESKIPILQDVQKELGYVGKEYIKYISKKTGIPFKELHGVATFYTQFNTEPVGRHTIQICEGTSCYIMGNRRNKKRLKDILNIETGETTDDLRFTLESVRCLGCCALSPTIKIDDQTFGRVKPDQIEDILKNYE